MLVLRLSSLCLGWQNSTGLPSRLRFVVEGEKGNWPSIGQEGEGNYKSVKSFHLSYAITFNS